MLTTLEQYRELQKTLAAPAMGNKPMEPERFFANMELLYRIQILESFRNLEQIAPVNAELTALSAHYSAVDALVSHLLTERRYRPSQDAEVQQARDTARQALCSIVTDYRKRFSAYMPESEEQYAADITKVINTVLPAWLAYRETMLAINKE
ncbi:MAG TPA: hypothetical protein PKW29_06510 [Clostridia bacterium]|nr:hypothetical protein [Clostridia bacterium]